VADALETVRHDAIANIKCFWAMGSGALGQQRPNFDGYIYIHYAARPYSARLASALFTSCRLATFAWVHFAVCDAWQRSKMQNLRRLG